MDLPKYTMVVAGPVYKTGSDMKERILSNWNLRRILYLAMGIAVIVQGIHDKEWVWLLPGAYFASMGLFGFGCAAGNCYGGSCQVQDSKKQKTQ